LTGTVRGFEFRSAETKRSSTRKLKDKLMQFTAVSGIVNVKLNVHSDARRRSTANAVPSPSHDSPCCGRPHKIKVDVAVPSHGATPVLRSIAAI